MANYNNVYYLNLFTTYRDYQHWGGDVNRIKYDTAILLYGIIRANSGFRSILISYKYKINIHWTGTKCGVIGVSFLSLVELNSNLNRIGDAYGLGAIPGILLTVNGHEN